MVGFDPERATRQQFLDALLGALAARQGGEGYGWHFTGIHEQLDRPATVVWLETPRPLVGYSDDQPRIEGPHLVKITIVTAPSEAESEAAEMAAHAQAQSDVYDAQRRTRHQLADRLNEYVGRLGCYFADPRPGSKPFASDLQTLRHMRAQVIADLREFIADLRDEGD